MADDPFLDRLSPELRAQFEQLQKYMARFTLPQRPLGRSSRKYHRRRNQQRHDANRPRQVRYTIPPSWENRGGKRSRWQYDMFKRVLKATADLLDESSTRAFTVVAVAKRAGVARSTIYKYFGIKAELLAKCVDAYWFSGHTAQLNASERTFYRLLLQALHRYGADGVPVKDLLVSFAMTVARSRDRNLTLLAAAEGVRSKRPPHYKGFYREPSPLRSEISSCLRHVLFAGREPGTGSRCPALTEESGRAVMHVLEALMWYEAFLNGPSDDERWLPEPTQLLFPRGKPRLRGSSQSERKVQEDICHRAISWVLEGAGLSELRLMPLPPLTSNNLPQAVRQGHPTGLVVDWIQTTARLVDLDDLDALIPYRAPQTPPLEPPPPLPTGHALSDPS